MDSRIIKNALKDYKRKEGVIETTLLRIEAFEKAMNDPDSFTHVFPDLQRELGMPKGTGTSSAVEIAIENKEQAIELLSEWIKDDKSRIYPYQIEIEQIDAALEALTKEERFIIECMYFKNMFWKETETSFNYNFRQKNYITVSGIRKINTKAIKLLVKILDPFYNRLKIEK